MKTIKVLNYSLAVLAALSVSTVAYAQGTSAAELDKEVDAEIGRMAAPASQKSSAVVTQTIVVPQPAAQTVEVQKQPVTLIEATPLSASAAEGMRKSRQEEEMKTESKIVEKLESSRLEDEKRRADVLFGNKFQTLEQKPAVVDAAPAIVAPAPVVVAQPQVVPSSQVAPQVIIQEKSSISRDDVREEVRAALDEDKESELTGNTFESKYMAVTAGMVSYPTLTDSIKAGYSLGAAIGTTIDNLAVEVGFNYGQSDMWAYYPVSYGYGYNNYVSDFKMNQYQGYLASKFQLMNGMIRPNLGGILAYTYRSYVTNSIAMDDGGRWVPEGTQFGTTHAVDLGITAGVDFAVSKSISLGADLKYMLLNVMNSGNGNRSPGYKTAEKENYFTFGAAARFSF